MTVLERGSVPEPVLRKEAVPVESLGGDVVVRGLELTELLMLSGIQRALREPLEGETEDAAHARAGAQIVAKTLHVAVLMADGKPLWSEAQWNVHGAKHLHEAMGLYNKVNQLSGQDAEAVEKN